MLNRVLEVHDIDLTVLRTNPPTLHIVTKGTVPTGGWSEPELIPHIYVMPPVDGVYGYDFVAQAPPAGSSVTQVVTRIDAFAERPDMPADLRGVRVHTSTNSQVSLLGEGKGGPKTVCVQGTLVAEGVECQALRGDNGELYTLIGNLSDYTVGDHVCVCGTIAEISFCQQGITIAVSFITKEMTQLRAQVKK